MVDLENRSIAYTAIVDGKIIGCAGITPLWQGVGSAWMALSVDAEKHMFWASKLVRRFIRDITNALNLHRVEMVALVESERNQRWAKFLGFKEEGGIAHQYTSDKRDMIRYEWVRKDG